MRTCPALASLPLATLLLVTGCVSAPRAAAPAPIVRAVPPPPAPAPLAADWRDWPVARGTWTYARDARGTVAMFGSVGADAVAVLRCDARLRRLFLSRAGVNAAPMTVRTTSITRVVPVGATGGTPPYVAATLAPSDPLLDAVAFSRGRFALDQPGTPPLALPAWAEVGRVIEDCRGAG